MKRIGTCKNCNREIYFGKWLSSWEKERWIHKSSNNEDCMLYATPAENKYVGKRAKEVRKKKP